MMSGFVRMVEDCIFDVPKDKGKIPVQNCDDDERSQGRCL